MPRTTEETVIFKELFAEMLANNGNFEKLAPSMRKPFIAYVYTSVPKFFVSDGNHFVSTIYIISIWKAYTK